MKPSPQIVGKVITILKKQITQYENPAVTEVSENTGSDPFKVLISCLISLRTKDEVTLQAAKRLFKLADTPRKMLNLKTNQISKAIYPAGFYKTKAKRIKEICKTLLDTYGGKVPDTEEELLKLKGVGRKTCNIVLIYGYHKPALAIDTHCNRIPNRWGWVKTKTPEETEKALERIIPKKYWLDFNNTLVAFGQNICVPISPKCSICPVEQYCGKVGVVRHR